MGKIPQGILGGVSGKIGGIVGSSWKGINVIKTKPLSVANPRTAAQVAQREKFANCVAFAGVILASVIKPCWDRFASRESGYNAFISQNVALFATVKPDPPATLVTSKGKMAKTDITAVASADGTKVLTIDWSDDSGEGFKLSTDEVHIVAQNAVNGSIIGVATAATRVDTTVNVSMKEDNASADTILVYLTFRRADGTVVSNNSYYLETVA